LACALSEAALAPAPPDDIAPRRVELMTVAAAMLPTMLERRRSLRPVDRDI